MCSVDPFREATESGEGPPQRHPVQSPTHDPRQKVPPQDIQVGAFIYLFYLFMYYLFIFYNYNFVPCLQKIMQAYSIIKNIYVCIADSVA